MIKSVIDQEQQFLSILKSTSYASRADEIFRKFKTYHQLLTEWNKSINLISHNDLNKLWDRHFLDSIQPLLLSHDHFNNSETVNIKIIDIGSGAGLPGIPIHILLENSSLVLVESIEKKCRFIEKIIHELDLKNCTLICDRAEMLGQSAEHREQYNIAFSRAIAKPPVALELVLPFIEISGSAYFFASGSEWKDSGKISKISKTLGCKIISEKNYSLLGVDPAESRRIICIKKTEKTDSQFPRRVGIPGKRPLK